MSEWAKKRINELGRVVTGKTPPKEEPYYFEGEELFISPKDLDWNQLYVRETETRISHKALEKFRNQVIPKNSVMFTSLSFGFGKMGITSRVSLTNQQINSVVVNSDNDFRFVYYLLEACTPFIFAYNSGIDTPIVPKSVFERIELRCPKSPVQRKIAAVLWTYDELIENSKERIALLERLTEEVYREWFVRLRFPGHETLKKVKGLPGNWRIKRVKEIVVRKSFGRIYREAELLSDGQTVVIDQSRADFLGFYDGEPQHLASPDAPMILFGDHTCKMVFMTKAFSLAENVIPFIPSVGISPYFLFHLIRYLAKTTEYKRHWTDLSNREVLVPKEDLQIKFDNIAKPIHQQIELLRENIIKTEKIRNLLLPRLISGNLSIAKLDIQFPPGMAEELNAELTTTSTNA